MTTKSSDSTTGKKSNSNKKSTEHFMWHLQVKPSKIYTRTDNSVENKWQSNQSSFCQSTAAKRIRNQGNEIVNTTKQKFDNEKSKLLNQPKRNRLHIQNSNPVKLSKTQNLHLCEFFENHNPASTPVTNNSQSLRRRLKRFQEAWNWFVIKINAKWQPLHWIDLTALRHIPTKDSLSLRTVCAEAPSTW